MDHKHCQPGGPLILRVRLAFYGIGLQQLLGAQLNNQEVFLSITMPAAAAPEGTISASAVRVGVRKKCTSLNQASRPIREQRSDSTSFGGNRTAGLYGAAHLIKQSPLILLIRKSVLGTDKSSRESNGFRVSKNTCNHHRY